MVELNNGINRFSNRVTNYIKYRPDYPYQIIEFLQSEIGLNKNHIIADIGSGTGLSALNFLKNGNKVIGVEPNDEMRAAGEDFLKDFNNFESVNGNSENTNIDSNSIDLIIAGQAFHWFDIENTKVEFKRILKSNGKVILIWNEKDFSKPLMSEYEKFIIKHGTDYEKVRQENINTEVLNLFYKEFNVKTFYNKQIFDFEALKGRLLSSSYIPLEENKVSEMISELKNMFDKHKNEDKVDFEYITKVYYGII